MQVNCKTVRHVLNDYSHPAAQSNSAAAFLERKLLEARLDQTNLDLSNPQPSGSPTDK